MFWGGGSCHFSFVLLTNLIYVGYTMYILMGGGFLMNTINASICRWGNSRGVRLPKAVLDIVGLHDDDEVTLSIVKDAIVIKKAVKTTERSYPSLRERFDTYAGDYVPEEWDVGKPMGREI